MTFESAEHVQTPEGVQYHIAAKPGDVAEYILLVGDAQRAEKAAASFRNVRFRGAHREYVIITGEHQGLDMSVVCVGMGAGSMEIAVVELCQITRAPTFIRAGSSGALQEEIALSDLVITQGAVRLENTSLGYVEEGYPAFAHAEVQIALVRAAEELRIPYHIGVTATASGFFGSQGRHVEGFVPRDEGLLDRLKRQGVKNLEMETSCLLTLASVRGVRAGAVCTVFANRPRNLFIEPSDMPRAEAHVVAVAMSALHHAARIAEERGARAHWHDGLKSTPV